MPRLLKQIASLCAAVHLIACLSACAPAEGNGAQQRAEEVMTGKEPAQEAPQERFDLVLLGDSLTQGYGLAPQHSLPAQLQRRLDARRAHVNVRNAGASGDTSAQGLARFDRATAGVDGVVIQFGANDMMQGRDPSAVRADLSALITRAHARGLWVGLVGMRAPPIAGAAYRAAFDQIYPDLAQAHGVPLYAFYFEGLIDTQTGSVQPGLFLSDRVHPSDQGVAVVADGMAAWLERTLPGEALQREVR